MISLPGMQYKVNKIKKISLGLPTNHKTRNATARHQTQPLIALLQKNYQSPVFAETTHVSVRHCTLINNTHKTRQYTQHKPPEAYNYRHNLNHTHTNQQYSQNLAIHTTQTPRSLQLQTQPEPYTHQSTILTKPGYTHNTNPQKLTITDTT